MISLLNMDYSNSQTAELNITKASQSVIRHVADKFTCSACLCVNE